MLMLYFKVKNGVEKLSYFPKFFLQKIGVVSSNMGLKQTFRKIEPFQKLKFVTSG